MPTSELKDIAIRNEVARSREHDDPTIQRALTLVGQALNPIKVVDRTEAEEIYKRSAPQPPSPRVVGFRAPFAPADPLIYINRESDQYKEAAKKPGDKLAQLLLSATLAHEQVHNTDGEMAARRLEADYLESKLSLLSPRDRQQLQDRIEMLNHLAAANRGN
jgi:hypothetical protein